MTAFEITSDHVRRWPFAVNPARITDADEAAIAEDMALSAARAGHRPKLPASSTNNDVAREKVNDMFNQITLLMRDGRERTLSQIQTFCGVPRYDARYACVGLVQMGVLRITDGGEKSNTGAVYVHANAKPKPQIVTNVDLSQALSSTAARNEAMVALRKEGWSRLKMAEIMGIPLTTVNSALRRIDLRQQAAQGAAK